MYIAFSAVYRAFSVKLTMDAAVNSPQLYYTATKTVNCTSGSLFLAMLEKMRVLRIPQLRV